MQSRTYTHKFLSGFALLAAFAVIGAGCNGGSSSTASSTGSTTAGGATAGGDASKKVVNKAEGNTIKIGLVAALNGDLKPWGQDSQNGAKLAVAEINKAGGINGKQVQLLIEDSASKPEQGKSAAEKLISEGCLCVIGEVSSGISAAMKGATTSAGIPQIAVGATKTTLTDDSNDMFRVCYTDKLQGPVMAKFAYDELRLRKMAVITDEKQPYSVGLSDEFSKYFIKLGGQIVDEEKYNSGQTQFSAQLTNVKSKNPDGVFCSGYFTEVGPIVKQARDGGIDKHVPFLGGDGWDSLEIVNSGGDAIVGSFFCNHYNNKDANPAVQTFLKKWTAAYGSLPGTTMGALGYDAAGLAMDALKRSKSLDSSALRDAIDNTENYPGVSGVITLKGHHGDPPKRALVVQLTADKNQPQIFRKAYDYYDLFPDERPKTDAAAGAPTPAPTANGAKPAAAPTKAATK